MNKTINDFSLGLVLWQLVLLTVFICLVYFAIKIYKKIMSKK